MIGQRRKYLVKREHTLSPRWHELAVLCTNFVYRVQERIYICVLNEISNGCLIYWLREL